MTAKEAIPTLQATAKMLLPGMRHARSLLDVSIQVLQYFEAQAAKDADLGTFTQPVDAEKKLLAEVENVKALLSAFGRLQGKCN